MEKDNKKHTGHMTNKKTSPKNSKTQGRKQTHSNRTMKENKE